MSNGKKNGRGRPKGSITVHEMKISVQSLIDRMEVLMQNLDRLKATLDLSK